jgi:hypothetical protein
LDSYLIQPNPGLVSSGRGTNRWSFCLVSHWDSAVELEEKYLSGQSESAPVCQLPTGNLGHCLVYLSQEEYLKQLHINSRSTGQLHALLPVEWLIFLDYLFGMAVLMKAELVSLSFSCSFLGV